MLKEAERPCRGPHFSAGKVSVGLLTNIRNGTSYQLVASDGLVLLLLVRDNITKGITTRTSTPERHLYSM